MERKTGTVYFENKIHNPKTSVVHSLKDSPDFQSIFIGYDNGIDVFANIRPLLGKGIQYLAVINKQGRMESIFGNEDVLSHHRKEIFGMSIRLQNSLQEDFNDEFGAVNYITIERDDSRFFILPYPSYIIFFITDKHLGPIRVINKIKKINWCNLYLPLRPCEA